MEKKSGESTKNSEILFFPDQTPFRSRELGCLTFVRINRLGRALNNGKGFSKISKPTERNGAYHLQFDFP